MTKEQWFSHTFAAAIALLLAAPLTFFALDRDHPLVVISAQVVNPDVRPGEDLRIVYRVSRRRDCETVTYPTIYDGGNVWHVFQPEYIPDAGDLGRSSFVVSRRIPSSAEPGEARYRVTLTWVCPYNVFHKVWPIRSVFPEIRFNILPPVEEGI